MPSVSKKQQKFMGIVRSIQKGEAPAGKFSKDAQDAAKKMKKSSVRKYAKTKHDDLPTKKEGVQKDRNNLALQIIDLNNMLGQARLSKNPKAKKYIKMIQKDLKDAKKKLSKLKEERDYKAEYKKFQSSTKAKKYRAELNKYNRKKGTYGNGDGKDASHKGGKIVGFEKESVNRGRAEKSRLKKEANMPDFNPMIDKALDEVIEEYTMSRKGVIDKIATLAKANKYGNVDGTQMNGKTAKQIIAIYNHPKMKRFKKAMADYTVDQFVDLTIKLPKVLGIKVESVNEASSKIKDFRMIVKQNKPKRVDNMTIDVPTAKAIIKKYKSLGKHQKQKFITRKLKIIVKSVNESINEAGMELKKLEDAIKFFKKKIEKQGRVTNARDEEHLERLMKVYNDMGGRKIKENNELFEWLQEACWKGYEKKGMKTMFGKRYPNCVKKTKKEGVYEGTTQKFNSAKIDRAIKIAKSMGGNMTGAVKKIEKIEKNLSKNGRVEYALQQANEGLGDKMSKISKKYAKGQKKSKKALKNKKGPYQEGVNENSKVYSVDVDDMVDILSSWDKYADGNIFMGKNLHGKKSEPFATKYGQQSGGKEDALKALVKRWKKLDVKPQTTIKIFKAYHKLPDSKKMFSNPDFWEDFLEKNGITVVSESINETPYELGGMKVYSKADGLKKVKSMQKTDGAKIYKVTKTKTKLYGKHPVTMYNLHTKNKNHSTRQNPYGLDMMKGVYLIPVKESVNEGLDKRQAAELLKQLGGNKFIAMTGAKNFGIGKDGLSFKIGRNAKAVNYVVIQLNGKDLYDMKFQKGTRVLKKANDVYADQLQKMFTKHTGMYTRL